MWILMNVLQEESPALGLGSVSTHLGVTSASVILVSTSCTLEANINVTTSTNVPWGSISAVAMLAVTTCTGPTSVNVKTDTRVTDGTVCISPKS